ncbi:hypothetical protein EKL97_10165 [Flavobacterium sp. LS1P28]|uniref:hypothetical protein n=1 Tax=Flavobacterium sp. LS1P28 TaxID=2497752 RepID=UPI000F842F25|nr:hypothetical protein [Flavobacterium sp. LS1P28]RTY80625.1 hypothetical protein EKL97_10165 [Flavobacterium sp. LS1P28]
MKKVLIAVLCFVTLISCEKKDEKMKENFTLKLKEQLKNPDSFEFVSMNISKTFTVKERKKTTTLESLNEIREINKQLPSEDLLKHIETEYNFLEKQTDENKEAVYYVDFIAKGTNSFGGIIQSKYSATVLNDENLTVLSISKND